MKKKYSATIKDKEDWSTFTKQIENVHDKDEDLTKQNFQVNKMRTLDLHGLSLDKANKSVKKFIIESFEHGYKKLLVITGKGSRSNNINNPYASRDLSILKYSVPEFIKSNQNLMNVIKKIDQTEVDDKESGAFNIYLKKLKE